MKDTNSIIFHVGYISTMFGTVQSVGDGIAAWHHEDVPANPDGSIDYAITLSWGDDSDSFHIHIADDLPESLWYQMHGYACLNGIEFG